MNHLIMFPIEENKRIAKLWLLLVSEGKIEEICAMTHPDWIRQGLAGLSKSINLTGTVKNASLAAEATSAETGVRQIVAFSEEAGQLQAPVYPNSVI